MKLYIIESKPADFGNSPEPEWIQHGGYSNREEAEAEWHRLDDLHGHDTYHRLVEVRRKILLST